MVCALEVLIEVQVFCCSDSNLINLCVEAISNNWFLLQLSNSNSTKAKWDDGVLEFFFFPPLKNRQSE